MSSLSCHVCFEEYDLANRQPRVLNCFHTFCGLCLSGMASSNPICCPFCSRATPVPAGGVLPLNYALRDIVEETVAKQVGKKCEFHEEDHAATHWCTECEQGMCAEVSAIHTKARALASHHVHPVGEATPPTLKPVLCSTHGKDLELVCLQDNSLVCALCVVTTHHGHRCETVDECFAKEREGMAKLVATAQLKAKGLKGGAESIELEKIAVEENKVNVKTEIDAYFEKVHAQLVNRQNELLTKVDSLAAEKQKRLHAQLEGLCATVDGVSGTTQQLEAVVKKGGSKAKALVMLKQLQAHLLSFTNTDEYIQPHECADIGLIGASDVDLFVRVDVEDNHTDLQTTSLERGCKVSFFPLTVTARSKSGKQQKADPGRFTITAEDDNLQALPLNVTANPDGSLTVQSKCSLVNALALGVTVNAKLQGSHVSGSPLYLFKEYSWANCKEKEINFGQQDSSCYRINGVFRATPLALNFRLKSKFMAKCAARWRIMLDPSAQTPFAPLAAYEQSVDTVAQNFTIQLNRELSGEVALIVNDAVVWRKELPLCFVYVNIFGTYAYQQVEIEV